MMPGAMPWNIVGSRCPPHGVIAWPDGKMRGPGTKPASIARINVTSRSRPPVCTNSPRLRTVVNPASKVRRAAGIARMSFIAGSSDTALNMVPPFPPIRKLSSMSMSPGSSVVSPRSITSASSGTDVGDTSRMCSPCTTTTPGSTMLRVSRSSRRAARSTTGCDGGFGGAPANTVSTVAPSALVAGLTAGAPSRGRGMQLPSRARSAASSTPPRTRCRSTSTGGAGG